MCHTLPDNFARFLLFFCMILYDFSHSVNSSDAASYNSSEEIKNIFKPSDDRSHILNVAAVGGNFAEGGFIDESITQPKSSSTNKNSEKYSSTSPRNASAFTSLFRRLNVSLPLSEVTRNNSYDSLQTSFIKALIPTNQIGAGSNLYLGLPEVVHINGTSSVKPRKGVHYSKIVPRKGVDNENEAFHISLEYNSCVWFSDKECYSNKEMHDFKCDCCKEDNVLGKNVKQTPVNCNSCKTFNILSTEENHHCRNICCNAISNNFYSVSSTPSSHNNSLNYQTASNSPNGQHNLSDAKISEKILLSNHSLKTTVTKENSVTIKSNSKLKPLITKVPYDAESMTVLLGKAQQKVFVPLAVSLFLLPLMGIVAFFLWQRTKEYLNKRYYKRMDFLIDGIYND